MSPSVILLTRKQKVRSACVTSLAHMWLKWLEKKIAAIRQRPHSHLQFAWQGLVKLQVSCSLKCKITISQQGTRFSLMPFGQPERFPCCPVFQRCVAQRWCLTWIHRAKSQKSRGSLLKNYKLKKKRDSSLVPGDLLLSWNQHPLTSSQAKARRVVC